MHFDRLSSAPVVQLMAAAALGLLVAPSVLARDAQNQAPGPEELVWLTLAVLVVGWVVALWPALSRELDRRLERLPIRSEQTRADVPLLTRLALGAGYVVLVQAILRRPLVLTLGPAFERFVVEAAFAAVMLLLLFGLLVALHRAAQRVVAGLAWLALDTAFATAGPSTPLADTPARANGAARQPVATTVAAPSTTIAAQPTRAATEPTLAATQPRAAEATGQQTTPAAEQTRDGSTPRPARNGRPMAEHEPTHAATEPTLAATQMGNDGQATVVAS